MNPKINMRALIFPQISLIVLAHMKTFPISLQERSLSPTVELITFANVSWLNRPVAKPRRNPEIGFWQRRNEGVDRARRLARTADTLAENEVEDFELH